MRFCDQVGLRNRGSTCAELFEKFFSLFLRVCDIDNQQIDKNYTRNCVEIL